MMKNLIILLILATHTCFSQHNLPKTPTEENLVSMEDVNVDYEAENGQQYYKKGSNKPFTGFLSARYDNGELESVQQYENGYGNGIWIDYDPDGKISCKGTYVNNRIEGPVTFYYEDGSIKSTGQYRHFKRPIGLWKFYDREGNIVSKRTYTR
ncbi:MAG: hypothetical protein KJP01_03530 [Gramella sp.]|nr:hypothetical protein [Christiangramia sp.]